MKLLFTGGLGDFITVESFMSDEERNSVIGVYLASKSGTLIKSIIEHYSIFPNLSKLDIFFDDWSRFFNFVDRNHMISLNEEFKLGIDVQQLSLCEDYNIINVFPKILNGKLLGKSTILQNRIQSIKPFGIINPYSPHDRQNGKRDFTKIEWDNVIKNIEKLNIPFAVINTSNDFVPKHSLLIDYSKKTSIINSIEIVKQAHWYIGIDSWIPALMSKYLPSERLIIKTVSSHYVQYLNIYLSPITSFGNVHCGLESFKL